MCLHAPLRQARVLTFENKRTGLVRLRSGFHGGKGEGFIDSYYRCQTFPTTFCRSDGMSRWPSVAATFCHGDIGHTTRHPRTSNDTFSTEVHRFHLQVGLAFAKSGSHGRRRGNERDPYWRFTHWRWADAAGRSRLTKMTAEERTRIAKLAAQARWGRKAEAPDPTDPGGPHRDQQGAEAGIMSNSAPPRCRSAF